MSAPGALGAALVDWTSGLAVGTAGLGPSGDHDTAAFEVAELARVVMLRRSFTDPVGTDTATQDVIVTTPGCYHLIAFLPAPLDASLLLHLRLDRRTANLALARHQLAALTGKLGAA
ncbi:hypothetical protein ACFYNO_17395 [Kitasatospora sp. NPDC006697]|uniref:hypothetical protein n=1 Tax=Kitasatospora sp. NPDC006697 TaxID=3364020 RepID=UPI0036B99718